MSVTPADFISPERGIHTVQDVLNIVDHYWGVGNVAPICRLRNEDLTPYALPAPDDPLDPTSIENWVDTVTPSWNGDPGTDIQGQLDFKLAAFPGIGQFNTLRDLVQVYVQYYDEANRPLLGRAGENPPLGVPLGVYAFSFPDVSYGDTGDCWSITGHDPTVRLAKLGFLYNYVVPAGFPITEAVRTILMMDRDPPEDGGRQPTSSPYVWPDSANPAMTPAGCPTHGPNIPAHRIRIPPSPLAAPSTIKLATNENMLAAVNKLLTSINYWPLTYDAEGNLWSGPMYDVSQPRPISRVWETGEDGVVLDPVCVSITNADAIGNVVECRCEDTSRPPMIEIRKNRALNSWVSIPNLGYPLMLPPVMVSKAYDRAMLQARADLELDFAAQGAEAVALRTWLWPFMGQRTFYGLYVWSPNGQELQVSSDPNSFLVTQWSMDFDKMQTNATLGRSVPM